MPQECADASKYAGYVAVAARGAAATVTTALGVLDSALPRLTGTHCADAGSEQLKCAQDRRVGVLVDEKSSRYDGVA